MRAAHVAAHAELYARVDFALGAGKGREARGGAEGDVEKDPVRLTTPELLRRAAGALTGAAAASQSDEASGGVETQRAAARLLTAQYFAFGRYITIAASRGDRGDAQPMNLQGVFIFILCTVTYISCESC